LTAPTAAVAADARSDSVETTTRAANEGALSPWSTTVFRCVSGPRPRLLAGQLEQSVFGVAEILAGSDGRLALPVSPAGRHHRRGDGDDAPSGSPVGRVGGVGGSHQRRREGRLRPRAGLAAGVVRRRRHTHADGVHRQQARLSGRPEHRPGVLADGASGRRVGAERREFVGGREPVGHQQEQALFEGRLGRQVLDGEPGDDEVAGLAVDGAQPRLRDGHALQPARDVVVRPG
jgi:hypothetical protein